MPDSFQSDSMLPTDLSTNTSEDKPACSLHSIVDRLAGMRKRSYPYETNDYNAKSNEIATLHNDDVSMQDDYDNGAQSDSSSLTTSHVQSTGGGDIQELLISGNSSRRKSSHPCRYLHRNDDDYSCDAGNDDDTDLINCGNKSATIWNPSEHIYPSCCKIRKSGRVSRGPISCIVRKLLSEMTNTVIATIVNDYNSKRSGRRPKLWISSTAHLGAMELQELAEQNLCNISSIPEESVAYFSDNQVVDHAPVIKRRRGRPPQLGNPFPSPSSTIPKLINDMMNAICFEIDGMTTTKRRGRPPSNNPSANSRAAASASSNRRPFSILVRRPRGNASSNYFNGNGNGSYRNRINAMSEEISRQAQNDVINSFVPLLQAAGQFNADALTSFINQSLPPFDTTSYTPMGNQMLCKSEPIAPDDTTLSLMQNLPDALSQLVVAQTFQQNVAAAALAAVAQNDFNQHSSLFANSCDFGHIRSPIDRRNERGSGRRGRRPNRSINPITHESLRYQQQVAEIAMHLAGGSSLNTVLPSKRSRAGRPRGPGRGGTRNSRRGRFSSVLRGRRSPVSPSFDTHVSIAGDGNANQQQPNDQKPAQNGTYARYSL
ncbi:hypothetical protein GJ496_007683 [Pomphorhynchus laevis]|nr:hypothetical protein GJ496_007683 [Pomphorhynchus laevis]